MDTSQLLQQLFQVLQATQPDNDATRTLQRTQSGIQTSKQLGIISPDQPFFNMVSQGVPGMIRSIAPSTQQPGFLDAWKTISNDYSIPLTDFTSMHQAGMQPDVFNTIMATDPGLGKQLLSFANTTGGVGNYANLAQVYGGAQAAPLMALPADAAALGAASALPGLTSAAEAGAGSTGILASLGLSAL